MDIYFERIKPLFDNSGKTDAELEREIGIPPKKISQWNVKFTKSYSKYIVQIAKYFDVSADYLLGNTDDPRPISDREEQKKPTPVSESGQHMNIIKIAGRDGRYIERQLSDEQLALFQSMLDQMKPIDDENI